MTPWHERECAGVLPPFSPVFPRSLRHRAANRYGDFVWSRGETRDPSKAEDSGLLPHVPLRYESSANVHHHLLR